MRHAARLLPTTACLHVRRAKTGFESTTDSRSVCRKPAKRRSRCCFRDRKFESSPIEIRPIGGHENQFTLLPAAGGNSTDACRWCE
jgi:hypothetical protein